MPIIWSDLEALGKDVGADFIDVLKPYLPALAREGQDVYEGFLKHLGDGEWDEIDKLMYDKMLPEERRQLEEQIYADARQATLAKYNRKELIKDIAFKITVRLLIKAATAGIV